MEETSALSTQATIVESKKDGSSDASHNMNEDMTTITAGVTAENFEEVKKGMEELVIET